MSSIAAVITDEMRAVFEGTYNGLDNQDRDRIIADVLALVLSGEIYVECRECDECGHIGFNDSHPTDAACHSCDWSGPEPSEDKCPGCARTGCMASACPNCSSKYRLVAESGIAGGTVSSAAKHWHDLYRKECLRRQDDAARYGQHIVDLEEEGMRRAGERKDAIRYQWLRDHFRFANDSLHEIWFDAALAPNDGGVPDDLDQEIDNARGGEP